MKDFLNYYYYIIVDRINMYHHNYYFTYQNHYFCLYRYTNNLEDAPSIFNLNSYMLYHNYMVNRIILNKEGNALTLKENYYYVLVLLENHSKDLISFKDIVNFNRQSLNINVLNRTDWFSLWSHKIDNIEYSIKHLMHKYKLLYHSIYYYIGLTENAISYLKYMDLKNDNISICHKRVSVLDTLMDFYNPLNLIIDYRVRDLAEYIKSCFFKSKMNTMEIINYLKKIKMSQTDYVYFYIRMLFPSYYFDLYDLIILGKISEDKIITVTKYQNEYEYLLYEIYLVVKSHVNIVGVEWINKKFAI